MRGPTSVKGATMCDGSNGNFIEDDGITTAFIAGYRLAMHDAANFVLLCADKLNERGLAATPNDILKLAEYMTKALEGMCKKLEG